MKRECEFVRLTGEHGYVMSVSEGRVSDCLGCGYNPAGFWTRLWAWLGRTPKGMA